MKVIILMGAPGSGKGSNAKILEKRLNIPQLSTGDILREEVDKKTNLGVQITKIINEGKLVSDNVMVDLIENRIKEEDCKYGFILDGFPRTLSQADQLDKLFAKNGINDYIVVELVVNEDIIIKRVLGRYTCAKCGAIYNEYFSKPKVNNVCDICGGDTFAKRSDDNEQIIVNRISIYNKNTLPVLKYYKDRNKYHTINGLLDKQAICEEIAGLLK